MITGFRKINKPSFPQSQFANEHKLYVFQVVGFLPTFLFYFSCYGINNGLLDFCAQVIICNIIYSSLLFQQYFNQQGFRPQQPKMLTT
jgi:hypothetical protein